MGKIIKFVILDILKSKSLVIYTLLMFFMSFAITQIAKDLAQIFIVLIFSTILPLFSSFFTMSYVNNNRRLVELLLSQPISRTKIWFGLYLGLLLWMECSFFVGVGLPFLLSDLVRDISFDVIAGGVLLSAVFTSIGMLTSVLFKNKMRGIVFVFIVLIFLGLIYDIILVAISTEYSDYPIDELIAVLVFFNPIDIARIYVLKMDSYGVASMVLEGTFGQNIRGVMYIALFVWIFFPLLWSFNKFLKKDY